MGQEEEISSITSLLFEAKRWKGCVVDEVLKEVFFIKDSKRKKKTKSPRDFENPEKEDSSLSERRITMTILNMFIDYFCIEKRIPLKDLLDGMERIIIMRVLSLFDGNQKKAAKFLHIKPTTLCEKLKRYNIQAKS